MSNEIDTMKKRGRLVYDQHRKKTSTGSEVVDIEGASCSWENFSVFHRVFGEHPTWVVGQCRDTASLSSAASSNPTPSASVDTGSRSCSLSSSAAVIALVPPATPTAPASGKRVEMKRRNKGTPVKCVDREERNEIWL